jgi:hypothetical protein
MRADARSVRGFAELDDAKLGGHVATRLIRSTAPSMTLHIESSL